MLWPRKGEPVLIVNKADCPGADATLAAFESSHGAALRMLQVSARDGRGLDALAALFAPGLRGAFVGTSGVGKSSLANALCPALGLETGENRVEQLRDGIQPGWVRFAHVTRS